MIIGEITVRAEMTSIIEEITVMAEITSVAVRVEYGQLQRMMR